MASHTRSGVRGMSMCRTPRCDSASTTAFWIAGVEPIVPVSPIPFPPRGLFGLRVSVVAVTTSGTSPMLGVKYASNDAVRGGPRAAAARSAGADTDGLVSGRGRRRSQAAAFVAHLWGGWVSRRAAVLHRPRAHGACASLDDVGVGMDHEHRVGRQAPLLGGELGQRGLMPLSEGSGAAEHRCGAGRLDPGRSPFRPGPTAPYPR